VTVKNIFKINPKIEKTQWAGQSETYPSGLLSLRCDIITRIISVPLGPDEKKFSGTLGTLSLIDE